MSLIKDGFEILKPLPDKGFRDFSFLMSVPFLYSHLLKAARKADQELDLDPSTDDVVEQQPKAVALKFSAVAVVREAQALAKEGKVAQAIKQYQKALKLNPEIDLNPDTEELEQDPVAVAKSIAEAAGDL